MAFRVDGGSLWTFTMLVLLRTWVSTVSVFRYTMALSATALARTAFLSFHLWASSVLFLFRRSGQPALRGRPQQAPAGVTWRGLICTVSPASHEDQGVSQRIPKQKSKLSLCFGTFSTESFLRNEIFDEFVRQEFQWKLENVYIKECKLPRGALPEGPKDPPPSFFSKTKKRVSTKVVTLGLAMSACLFVACFKFWDSPKTRPNHGFSIFF